METVKWKVEGMTCANCALTINKYLDKKGMSNIRVNPIDGDVSFDMLESSKTDEIKKGIDDLGYHVIDKPLEGTTPKRPFLSTTLHRFLFCLPFTLILMLHMLESIIHIHWLMNPWDSTWVVFTGFYCGNEFLWEKCHY